MDRWDLMSDPVLDPRVAHAVQRSRFHMMVLLDVNFSVVWFNTAAQGFFGPALHAGSQILKRIHPDDVETSLAGLVNAVNDVDGTSGISRRPARVLLRIADANDRWQTLQVSIENHASDDLVGGIMVSLQQASNQTNLENAIEALANGGDISDTLGHAIQYLSDELNAVTAAVVTRFGNESVVVPAANGCQALLAANAGWGPVAASKLNEATITRTRDLDPELAVAAHRARASHALSLPIFDERAVLAGAIVAWVPYSPVFAERPNGAERFVSRLVRLAIIHERDKRSLLHQLRTDPLTGLANRIGLDRVLDSPGQTDLPLTVLYCDVDHFKELNDIGGHALGDRVLAHVGEQLRQSIRPNDVAVRLGGDEFVVVCPGLGDPDQISALVERIRGRVEGGSGDTTCRLSIGGAVAHNIAEVGGVVERADLAMYQDKRSRYSAPSPSPVTQPRQQASRRVGPWSVLA